MLSAWRARARSSGRPSTTIAQRRSDRSGQSSCALSRQRLDEGAEARAARLEIAELVEGRAGGREQHGGAARPACRLARRRDRFLDGAAERVGNGAFEGRGKILCRLADEKGAADAREEGR